MRVLLERVFDHESAVLIYGFIGERLLGLGHEVASVASISISGLSPQSFDVLISHGRVPRHWRDSIVCYGGNGWTRAQILGLLEDHGVATMPWKVVRRPADLESLFDEWGVERVLKKPSNSHGGDAVEVFTRESIGAVEWDPDDDVFCAELDPASGDVYKIEVFNGIDTVTWMSDSPPIKDQMPGSYMKGLGGAYGDRRLIEAPVGILQGVVSCSRAAASLGVGYMSFDFMTNQDGDWVAIEANLELVATWWTAQFAFVKERYAEGVLSLPQFASHVAT